MSDHLSTFYAQRIRWAIIAGRTPSMWPVYPLMPCTRKAFDRSFTQSSAWMLWPALKGDR